MTLARLPRCATLADTRSHRGPRVLIGLISGLVLAALAWAGWAEVEQIVRATGQVEPEAHLQIINHARGGRVAEVLVREGDRVAAGDALLRLDPELDASALRELQGRLRDAQLRVARLEAELGDAAFMPPPAIVAAHPNLAAESSALLAAQRNAMARRLAQLASTERQRTLEVAQQRAEIGRLEATLALLKEEAAAIETLADKGLTPRLQRITVRRRVADITGELAVAKSAAAAAIAARDEAAAARARLVADHESDVRLELAQARAEAANLDQALARQSKLVADLEVTASVSGIVQDVALTAPGQSFAAYAPLLTLVPTEGALVVEAKVPEREIGRLHVGQAAVVKVAAYDYLRFGALDGEIRRIAADASTDEGTGEVTYNVLIVTDRAALNRGGTDYALVPGMLVDVELRVGERSVLSFLTDRILMLGDAAFREG